MIHYTARNGTTFHFDPLAPDSVQVTSPDFDGTEVPLDVQDLREFLQHLEDQPHFLLSDYFPPDADAAAVGPD